MPIFKPLCLHAKTEGICT